LLEGELVLANLNLKPGSGNPSFGQWIHNVAGNTIKIHSLDSNLLASNSNLSALGIGNCRPGFKFKFAKTSSPSSNYKTVTLTSPGAYTDLGGGVGFWEWSCSIVTTGTVANNDATTLTSLERIWDERSATAFTPLKLRSAAYVAGEETALEVGVPRGLVAFDSDGIARRSYVAEPIYCAAKSTAASTNPLGSWTPPDNTYGFV